MSDTKAPVNTSGDEAWVEGTMNYLEKEYKLGNLTLDELVAARIRLKGGKAGEKEDLHFFIQKTVEQFTEREREVKQPWRVDEKETRESFQALMAIAEKEETVTNMQKRFEQQITSGTKMSTDMVYILYYLLYMQIDPAAPRAAMIYLAIMLMDKDSVTRLKLHNWEIQRTIISSDMKEDCARAIHSGNLTTPLFPSTELAARNIELIRTANEMGKAETLVGAGPTRKSNWTVLQKRLRENFLNPEHVQPFVGGGPQTSVNVYVPGNPEAVGLADTTLISDGMSEMAGEMNRIKEQNVHLKKNVQALERKIAALLAGPTYASLPAPAGNRGGYGGRGGWRGRAGGNRGGRGFYNNYQGNYRGGGEVEGEGEQLLITDGYEAPKNA